MSHLVFPTFVLLMVPTSLCLPQYKYSLAGHSKGWINLLSDSFSLEHFYSVCLFHLLGDLGQVNCNLYVYILIK